MIFRWNYGQKIYNYFYIRKYCNRYTMYTNECQFPATRVEWSTTIDGVFSMRMEMHDVILMRISRLDTSSPPQYIMYIPYTYGIYVWYVYMYMMYTCNNKSVQISNQTINQKVLLGYFFLSSHESKASEPADSVSRIHLSCFCGRTN
jgi:hypothetical protein